jgi:hypothetical protein
MDLMYQVAFRVGAIRDTYDQDWEAFSVLQKTRAPRSQSMKIATVEIMNSRSCCDRETSAWTSRIRANSAFSFKRCGCSVILDVEGSISGCIVAVEMDGSAIFREATRSFFSLALTVILANIFLAPRSRTRVPIDPITNPIMTIPAVAYGIIRLLPVCVAGTISPNPMVRSVTVAQYMPSVNRQPSIAEKIAEPETR